MTAEPAVPQHDAPDSRPRAKGRGHWLSHAFAIEPKGASEPNEEQLRIIDRLCHEIVRRRLTAPAFLYLEVSRPLNYIGSQFLHFIRPILAVMLDTRGVEQFANFLEKRGSVDVLVARLEDAEDSYPSVANAADESSHETRKRERGC